MGVTAREVEEEVKEAELVGINQERLPKGGVGQCQGKERARQGGAGGGRCGSPEMAKGGS